MANPTKKKSKYSKKDLKALYPNKEELDNAWEYFHRLPENKKENFLNERRARIEVQDRLKQSAQTHFPDGNLPQEIRNRIINISFLAPEEQKKAAEEFLKEYPNQEDKTMTEENTQKNKSELYDEALNNWLKNKGIDLNNLSDDAKKAASAYFDEHGNLDDFETQVIEQNGNEQSSASKEDNAQQASHNLDNQEQDSKKVTVSEQEIPTESAELQDNLEQDTKKLTVSEQEIPAEPAQPQDEQAAYDERLQSIKEHWEKWCEETKDEQDQPLRKFKEIPNEDGFLKFEIEPTEALKAQNPEAKGAEVTYYSETEATMPMTDYAYFDEMAKAAKEVSQADVIECGNIKTPGYATRLIAAAYAHDMEVEMAPNKLDLSPEIIKDIPDDVMLKVLDKQIFNRDSNAAEKVDYESIKEGLAAYKAIQERQKDENGNPKGEMTALDISKMQFSDEAAKNKTIAAALEMGLKVEGVDKLKLNQETKEGIPEEAAKLLGTMQVGLLRAKVEKLHDSNTSEEEREALKTDKMKQFDAKDKKALIQQQIETLRNKDATKAEKDLAGVRLDTLQGKRWEQGYTNKRGGYE